MGIQRAEGPNGLRVAMVWAVAVAGLQGAGAEPLPVRTERFYAPSVEREVAYNVCLPEDYETSGERYPTLYLLHGLTQDHTAWARLGVQYYAQFHRLIIVMPSVGRTWYVNWGASPAGVKNRWEDFIVRDLIEHVDGAYRTIPERAGRAINGLSMGGYGALMLGLRHPDLFSTIGSHSGALGFARRARSEMSADGALATPEGTIFLSPEQCDAHDPFKLILEVPREALPHIYLDCGTEDGLIAENREFTRLLLERGIAFTFAQSEGNHAPPYWAREIGHSLAVQEHLMRRGLGQTVTLQRAPAATTSAVTAADRAVGSLPANWPRLEGSVEGPNEIRLHNDDAGEVLVAIRTGRRGLDFKIPAGESRTARVGNGRYRIYFVFAGEPDRLYEGDPFVLNNQGVELRLKNGP